MQRRWAVLACPVAAAVLLAACGGAPKAAAPPAKKKAPPTTTTTTAPPPVAPLTGLPQPNAAQLAAPAVVVKIDNVDQARPQSGINQADVVYEEMVEGGLTRLAAIFQSQYPTEVGPVRSGRLTDEGIADDLNHPVFAYSGTNLIILPQLRAQPFDDVDDSNHSSYFYRSSLNVSPHNLYASVANLATASTTHTAPAPLFTYLPAKTAFAGAGIAPAASVSIGFPSAAISWQWSATSNEWLRSQNGTADVDRAGVQASANNLIMEFIPYVNTMKGQENGVIFPIPDGSLVGTGTAWFLSDGQIVKGSWSRPSLTTVSTFSDSTGAPVPITPGRTWVELVPDGVTPVVAP